MSVHVHLKLNMNCLHFAGVIPLTFNNSFYNLGYKIYSKITFWNFVVFILCQYMQVLHVYKVDLFSTVSILAVALLYSTTILKTYICKSSTIKTLVDHVLETENGSFVRENHDVEQIYQEHVHKNYFVNKLLTYVGFITVAPYFLMPILEGVITDNSSHNSTSRRRPLPFDTWFPFDQDDYYYVCYVFHVFSGYAGTVFTVFTDIFFVGLMIFAIGQIKILQHCFENLENREAGDGAVATKQVVKRLVVMHQVIIKYVENLNSSLRFLMMIDFLIASLQMSMLGLQLITSGLGWQQLFPLEFLGAMFCQLFLFYWHANEILLESQSIAMAIWKSDWIEFTPDVKKTLLIVMLRSQRPLKLMVGPFYNMSTETALSIVRASYTYVAVIRQMYMRKT